MDITGRKLFVKILREEGVDTIFGYPGGMVTDIVDELYKAEGIHLVLGRHEQACVHEAEGYARATGKCGVVLVTSGPGATNTITGIADAYFDSIPMVIFTGQVPLGLIGNDAFQEVDIVGMTRTITKYTVTVRSRAELAEKIKMAFQIANTGKPGPVVVDIPKDIQNQSGSPEYPDHVEIRGYKPYESVHIGQLKKAYRVLHGAKKPVILAGGGVLRSGACELLEELAEKMDIPVVTTVMGKAAMGSDHPLYIGSLGMHGCFAANTAVSECDVLFSIGTRFNDRVTGELSAFAPNATIVHVDIATASISRNVRVDVPVVADAKVALEKLISWAEKSDTLDWKAEIEAWNNEHPLRMNAKGTINPQTVMESIADTFDDAIFVTDVGQHQMWATQYIPLKRGQRFITSGGLGTMGFGFPAAVGAAIGDKDATVVCITGDGGFQMNMQEMATALVEDAHVLVIIMNNQNLGMVRQMQQLFYGKRYSLTSLIRTVDDEKRSCGAPMENIEYVPDFMKWADAYGAKGIRVEKPEEVQAALNAAKEALAASSVVVEIMIHPDELVLPMVKSGNAMSNMILN